MKDRATLSLDVSMMRRALEQIGNAIQEAIDREANNMFKETSMKAQLKGKNKQVQRDYHLRVKDLATSDLDRLHVKYDAAIDETKDDILSLELKLKTARAALKLAALQKDVLRGVLDARAL